MKIYFSPCKSDKETSIKVIDSNTIDIDGEVFSFDTASIAWENLAEVTNNKILDAYRKDGELFIKILRFYKYACPWDTATYQNIV